MYFEDAGSLRQAQPAGHQLPHIVFLPRELHLRVPAASRAATDTQTVENQRFEITNFARRQGLEIDGWIEETVSGTKEYSKRRLGGLLSTAGKNDLIICGELSRLGRNLFMIMEILNLCMKKECRVWTIKDNYRLGDDITSKVLAFAFGLCAEIERDLISKRTKEALARKRAEGVVLAHSYVAVNHKRTMRIFFLSALASHLCES